MCPALHLSNTCQTLDSNLLICACMEGASVVGGRCGCGPVWPGCGLEWWGPVLMGARVDRNRWNNPFSNMYIYIYYICFACPHYWWVWYQLAAGSITSCVCSVYQPNFMSCHYMETRALTVTGSYTMLSTWELTIYWCYLLLILQNTTTSIYAYYYQNE